MSDEKHDGKLLSDAGWTVLRKLGEGGEGPVYCCIDKVVYGSFREFGTWVQNNTIKLANGTGELKPEEPALSELVRGVFNVCRNPQMIAAVKLPKLTGDVETSKRVEREIRAMKEYDHPNLIRLLRVDTTSPPYWFAMEFHQRGSLADHHNFLRYRGKPLQALIDIRPLVEGAAQFHERDAQHRDIKPGNIFVADDGRLVLGDFGIILPGKDATRYTGTREVASRDWVPDWVRFNGVAAFTPKVDVFMIGKVLFNMVFAEKVMASQLEKRLKMLRGVIHRSRVMEQFVDLIRGCIVIHEEDVRFPNASFLGDAIDRIIEGLCRDRTAEPRSAIGTTHDRKLTGASDSTKVSLEDAIIQTISELQDGTPEVQISSHELEDLVSERYPYLKLQRGIVAELVRHMRSEGRLRLLHAEGDELLLRVHRTPSVEEMVDRFNEIFMDPANGVPYETREGGYQYLFKDEPHDAESELRTLYPGAGDEEIKKAVEILEGESFEWVKRDRY